MKKITQPIFLLLLLFLAGCQITPEAIAETGPNAELRNTLWKLTELDGKPVQTSEGKRMASLTLTSEASQARIVTACNRGSAAYKAEGNSIRFEVAMSTKMMCEPEPMKQEAAFFKVIKEATRFEIKGEILELYNAENKLLARFHSEYLK